MIKIKVESLMNISQFADTHPITEESIKYFYNYWNFELDKYNINLNEYMQNNIRKYKESQEKTNDLICEEMLDIYKCSFGARCVWMITALANEFEDWDQYRIDLLS